MRDRSYCSICRNLGAQIRLTHYKKICRKCARKWRRYFGDIDVKTSTAAAINLKISYLNHLNEKHRGWQWYCRYLCKHHRICWNLREEMRPHRIYEGRTWVRCYYSKSIDARMFYARVKVPELHEEEYRKELGELQRIDEVKAKIVDLFVATLCIGNITFPYPQLKIHRNECIELKWKWKNGWSIRVNFPKSSELVTYLGYVDPQNELKEKLINLFHNYYSDENELFKGKWTPSLVICGKENVFETARKIIWWFKDYQRVECEFISDEIHRFHMKELEEFKLQQIRTTMQKTSLPEYQLGRGRKDIVARTRFCFACPQCRQRWSPFARARVISGIILRDEVCPRCLLAQYDNNPFIQILRGLSRGILPTDPFFLPTMEIIQQTAIASDSKKFLMEVARLKEVLWMSEARESPQFFEVINLLSNRIQTIYRNMLIEVCNMAFG